MVQTDILPLLLSDQPVSLACWFAEPLAAAQAEAWAPKIRHHAQASFSLGQSNFKLHLAGIIVRHWRGRDVEVDYRNLLAVAADRRQRAMLEICYGQLLIAQRCNRAWTHLDTGFQLAANVLESEEYFEVLKRYELLRVLPLSSDFSSPVGLDALLTEASVIRQLKGHSSRAQPSDSKHQDTLD